MDYLDSLCDSNGSVVSAKVVQLFYDRGILFFKDDRLSDFVRTLIEIQNPINMGSKSMLTVLKPTIPRKEFEAIVAESPFAQAVLSDSLVLPNFPKFTSDVAAAFSSVAEDNSGEVTTYIPGLSKYASDKWALAFCSVDGQVTALGDYRDRFTIQSVTKPILYGVACDLVGSEVVHAHVGKEPSGFGFNKIALGHGDIPHNPLINIGAITVASLIQPECASSERFETCYSRYKALAGGVRGRGLSFNNAVYLSERESGHRNYAIGHYLVNKGCIKSAGTTSSLSRVLELYFQLCSIEGDVRGVSVMGATLANGGRNVFTGERVISEESTRNMLSLMFSCGMYDYSGEWAFEVGLPAKSGVSGVILAVLPNVGSFAMWSPPLDSYGNSVRGVRFTKEILASSRQAFLHPFTARAGYRPVAGSGVGGVRSYHSSAASAAHTKARSYHSSAASVALSLLRRVRN